MPRRWGCGARTPTRARDRGGERPASRRTTCPTTNSRYWVGRSTTRKRITRSLRFLLYTGARKSEALRLKWEHVHGDRAVLPDSKTGPRTIWLASPARAVLAAQPRLANCPWVFASPCGGPATLDKAWNAVRAATGLPKLRIHDLRHSHAAVAVNGGEGLRVVAGLLGHADIKTTFGYAHLAEGSVADAANRVSR